jgi:hypothetical protein
VSIIEHLHWSNAMKNAALVTWLVLRISRWLFWLGFFAYCFYVNYFWADLVNQFGHLPFDIEVVIFGLANAAVFAGLLELMMRERAKIPRSTFGRLMPTSGSSNGTR